MHRVEAPGIYDWSKHEGPTNSVRERRFPVHVTSEDLRDGLQGTQVKQHPTLVQKEILLAHLSGLIEHADIGFPGSGEEHTAEIVELIKVLKSWDSTLTLSVAARGAVKEDVRPIVDISHKLGGYPLEGDLFLDGSRFRANVQGWDRDEKIKDLAKNIKMLKKQGLPVMFVPERATTTPPEELMEVCRVALDCGVDRLCLTDTQGIGWYRDIQNMFRAVLGEFQDKFPDLKWDAHFHNDRELGMANCLTAAEEGVDRIHGTVFGIGERTGNVRLSALLVNLNLEGFRDDDLINLDRLTRAAQDIFSICPPQNSPIDGGSAFSTSSGVHADTGNKEEISGVDSSTYFAFNPKDVGRKPEVEVGPFSGIANVTVKLRHLGYIDPSQELMEEILSVAKKGRGLLSDATIDGIALKYNCKKE